MAFAKLSTPRAGWLQPQSRVDLEFPKLTHVAWVPTSPPLLPSKKPDKGLERDSPLRKFSDEAWEETGA